MIDLKDIFQNLEQHTKEAEAALQEIVNNTNTENLLSCMVAQLMLTAPGASFGDKNGLHPAMIETLARFCIPKFGSGNDEPISPIVTNQCFSLLETIAQGRSFAKFAQTKPIDNSIETAVRLAAYSEIVRGAAYPEQTANKIKFLQGQFDNWFSSKVNISPSRAVEVFSKMVKHAEKVASESIEETRAKGQDCRRLYEQLASKKDRNEKEQSFFDIFSQAGAEGAFQYGCMSYQNTIIPEYLPIDLATLDLSPQLTDQEIDGFKSLFAVNKDAITSIEHIQRKPFYELPSGKLLFGEISNGYDVIWDEFEAAARKDSKFYDKRYQKKKANWLEQKAYEHLCQFFPSDAIFQSLTYPDPTKEEGTTELDLAVKWGPFLIVLEAKAKQFRFESITGNAAKLRTDIKKNVEEAYEQSIRAIQYIDKTDEPTFVEANTKRELKFKSDDIFKIFPVSLTFHHMAGISTQLDELKDMGLFKDENYPVSICESDLELLAKTNITPDIFLHYLSKRLDVLQDKKRWQGDELDLFSAYLDCRLLSPNLSMAEEEPADIISFGGYSEQFDQLMAFERGEFDTKPDIGMNLPDGVGAIFEQLKEWDDEYARWIAFSLLDLDDEALFAIQKCMKDFKSITIPHSGFRRMTIQHGDTCISVVGSSAASFADLKKHTHNRCMAEKYRHKARKSIAFGVICSRKETVFDLAEHIEFDWFHDPMAEQLIADEPPTIPSKIPKVNERCFCGSGKKYKKCCKIKVEDALRNRAVLR